MAEHTKVNRRYRSNNFTQECTFTLLNILEKYRDIIENKRTDSVVWQEKKLAWFQIANDFNQTAIEKRTPEQLKQKYEALKKEARREAASKLLSTQQSDGVAVPSREKTNPLFSKIRWMMELSAEESPTNQWATSMDSQEMQIQQGENSSQEEEVECDNEKVEVGYWATTIPSGSSTPATRDGRSDPNPIPNSPSQSSPSQRVSDKNIVSGADNLRKRKHSNGNKSSHSHIFKCCDLRSLVKTKGRLLTLEKDLLLKEFKEKQRREAELHQVNMSIKESQLKNEQLENQIKMEKLRKLVEDNQEFEVETEWK